MKKKNFLMLALAAVAFAVWGIERSVFFQWSGKMGERF